MGLDMYIYANQNKSDSYMVWDVENNKPDKTNYPKDLKELGNYIFQRNFKTKEVRTRYQIGYFRKFNALHGYIVENYADGVDICQAIYLDKKDIEKLRDICKEILDDNSKAKDLMPPTDGFFFGSNIVDQYYLDDMQDAYELFELILKHIDFKKYYITYQASW